jgi:shikimate kinase
MKNIVLIGFMGTGKTRIGRLLAGRLSCPFMDIDREIENQEGLTIAQMFSQKGEDFFRQKEREMVTRVSKESDAVVATGGGVVLFSENIGQLRATGIIICLTASVGTILERTGRRPTRPLLNQPDKEDVVRKLLAEREPLYRQAEFIVDTDHLSPRRAVEKIIDFLQQKGYYHG